MSDYKQEFQQFFSELDGGLKKSDYSERFKEELEDHIDDRVHARMVAGLKEKEAIEETKEQMGEARNLAKQHNTIMRFKKTINIYVEAAFVTLLFAPIFTILNYGLEIMLVGTIMAEDGSGTRLPGVILLIVAITLIPIILITTTKTLRTYIEKTKHKLGALLLILIAGIVPSLALLINTMRQTRGLEDFTQYVIISLAILTMLSLYTGGILYWALYKRKRITILKKPKSQKIGTTTKNVIGILVFLYMLVSTVMTLSTPTEQLLAADTAALLVQPIMSVLLYIIFYLAFGAVLPATTVTWIVGIAFLLLIAIALRDLYKRVAVEKNIQRTPWIKLSIAVFSISMLFGQFTVATPAWTVDAVDISTPLEKRQLGPFYRLGKHFSNTPDYAVYAYYGAKKQNGNVAITQNASKKLYTISNIKNNDGKITYDMESEKTENTGNRVGPTESLVINSNLPKGFDCIRKNGKKVPRDFTNVYDCAELQYGGKTLFTQEEKFTVGSIKRTDNLQYAVIVVSDASYPQTAYLVALPQTANADE